MHGALSHFNARDQQHAEAEKGLSHPFVEDMDKGYDTQLIGIAWKKIALSWALMRKQTDSWYLMSPPLLGIPKQKPLFWSLS